MQQAELVSAVWNTVRPSDVHVFITPPPPLSLNVHMEFRTCSFLANDVTLVTSYGYCQSLKINDIRDTSVLRSVRLGGYSVRRWVRVCTGTMKPFPYQRHIPLQLILWENARALKCFASASFDQREYLTFFCDQQKLFNVTSNALFCIL